MKNVEQKQEFLDALPAESRVLMERAFRDVEPLEDKLNKDCSFFTMDEIDTVYGHERYKGTKMLARKCDLLTKYVSWVQTHYPVKYATYSTYAEKNNLYIPTFSIDHFNPNRVYTDDEFKETLDEMSSMYDQMMFLAIYEGIWTSAYTMDFFLLNKENLDVEYNIVNLPNKGTMSVSSTLMDLLAKGANQTKRDGVGVQNSTFDCIMYRDPTICYKRLNVDPNMDIDDNILKIRTHMQNERRSVQKEISHPYKFTIQNIQMSGFLNTLVQAGIIDRFNDYTMYEENPVAGQIADRYDFAYRNVQKNNFHRRFEPYFLSAE